MSGLRFAWSPSAGGVYRTDMTKADVLAMLASNDAMLVKTHPAINPETSDGTTKNWTDDDHAAWRIFRLSYKLQQAIQTGKAWEAAALAMQYANAVAVYEQPELVAAIGTHYGRQKKPRRAKDELCMRVMRCLRRERGMTWKAAQRALEDAAQDRRELARVGIEHDGHKVRFAKGEKQEQFTVSTLRDKKYSKA